MNAYEIPGLRYSLPAGGAVERHRFVTAGQVLEIADGIVMVEAAKAVTAGKIAYADANGKVTDTGTVVAGIVITSAVAGGLAAVKIN